MSDFFCRCMSPLCLYDAFLESYVGMDQTNGRHGQVFVNQCRNCGRLWLKYHVEYEGFSKSGRWYRGVIDWETAKGMTPESAVSVLDKLEWKFVGGSYFNTLGRRTSGKLSVDL